MPGSEGQEGWDWRVKRDGIGGLERWLDWRVSRDGWIRRKIGLENQWVGDGLES